MNEDKLAAEAAFVQEVLELCLARRRARATGEENENARLDYTPLRAYLKRNSGRSLNESKNVSGFFYLLTKYRRGSDEYFQEQDENLLFLTATLLAQDRTSLDVYARRQRLPATPKNFGQTLDLLEKVRHPDAYQLKRESDPVKRKDRPISPLERRLRLLLDAALDRGGTGELPFRLNQCVRLILNEGGSLPDYEAAVCWPQLLYDLRRWDLADKPVQKHWARAFYGYLKADDAPVSDDTTRPNAVNTIHPDEE